MKINPRIDGVFAQGLKRFWPKRFRAMVAAKKFSGEDREGLTAELPSMSRQGSRFNSAGATILKSPNGTQCAGAIQFQPRSILNFKPTPIKKGDKVYLRPKVKIVLPHEVQSRGHAIKARVQYTREERIRDAKKHAELLKWREKFVTEGGR